jgi:hypothetical protein
MRTWQHNPQSQNRCASEWTRRRPRTMTQLVAIVAIAWFCAMTVATGLAADPAPMPQPTSTEPSRPEPSGVDPSSANSSSVDPATPEVAGDPAAPKPSGMNLPLPPAPDDGSPPVTFRLQYPKDKSLWYAQGIRTRTETKRGLFGVPTVTTQSFELLIEVQFDQHQPDGQARRLEMARRVVVRSSTEPIPEELEVHFDSEGIKDFLDQPETLKPWQDLIQLIGLPIQSVVQATGSGSRLTVATDKLAEWRRLPWNQNRTPPDDKAIMSFKGGSGLVFLDRAVAVGERWSDEVEAHSPGSEQPLKVSRHLGYAGKAEDGLHQFHLELCLDPLPKAPNQPPHQIVEQSGIGFGTFNLEQGVTETVSFKQRLVIQVGPPLVGTLVASDTETELYRVEWTGEEQPSTAPAAAQPE